MKLLSDSTNVWDLMYDQYGFCPDYTKESYSWIKPPLPFKTFLLPESCWNEAQEKMVNLFFLKLDLHDLFALDWQHDCFTYDPAEEIPLYYSYQDDQRQCMVYFPSYYPNGDYYFFGDAEWKYGLFGHPWLNEIVVTGEELIRLFEENSQVLGITAKKQ